MMMDDIQPFIFNWWIIYLNFILHYIEHWYYIHHCLYACFEQLINYYSIYVNLNIHYKEKKSIRLSSCILLGNCILIACFESISFKNWCANNSYFSRFLVKNTEIFLARATNVARAQKNLKNMSSNFLSTICDCGQKIKVRQIG